MAVYTPVSLEQAKNLCSVFGVKNVNDIKPVAAGSVNSNFTIKTAEGQRYFLRVYEEQNSEGLGFEHDLLLHLQKKALSVPAQMAPQASVQTPRASQFPTISFEASQKPVALFEFVEGTDICQKGVTTRHAHQMGHWIGQLHTSCDDFPRTKSSRFNPEQIQERMDAITRGKDAELDECLKEISCTIDSLVLPEVPQGIIHGDLFRDNVRWKNHKILAVLDWDSASTGAFVYDLAVTLLAWCYGDTFEWDLATSMISGYQQARILEEAEVKALHAFARYAAARFTVTRITDFHLRSGIGDRTNKDYRRFWQRLQVLEELGDQSLQTKLGL